jgi:hypothetical protein
VSPSDSESLVAPGFVSLIVPYGGSIMMSSSGFGTVGGSVFVVVVLGGVLFCGGACLGFSKLLKITSVLPLLYPVLEGANELEETEESDDSGRRMGSSFLLPDFDFKMLEDSFFDLVRWSELLCWAVDSRQIPHPSPVDFRGRLDRILFGWRSCLYRREEWRS